MEEIFLCAVHAGDTRINEYYCSGQLAARVKAGSSTSTVALRVVGGDEKGAQCLGI
jgi:hypothetical protein